MTSGPTNHGGWGAPDPGGSGWGSPPGGTPDAPRDDTATTTTAPDGPRETLQPDNV